jgi:hypothetical protein
MSRASYVTGIGVFLIACAAIPLACKDPKAGHPANDLSPTAPKNIRGVSLRSEGPFMDELALSLSAARNETTSAVVQLTNLPKPGGKAASVYMLRVQPLQLQSENFQIEQSAYRAYQVLGMPVDANRAGFVRHTGLKASSRTLPRALLPVPMDKGTINVSGLRDPSEPLKPSSRIGLSDEPATVWIDIAVPPTAKPGKYTTTIDLLRDGERIESAPLTLHVYDFVLPDERRLHMVGRIEWASLEALYPDLFDNITPALIRRGEKKYEEAVRLLDQFVALAQEHRTSVVVPRLQPVVKWPANQPPQVFWEEFDSVVEPWLSGAAFADQVPLGYWPLPHIDYLDRFPSALQMQYWGNAAAHFGQKGWMDRSWVEVEKETPGRATAQETVKLSTAVAEVLGAHPRLRATAPLEDHQLQFVNKNNPKLIDPAMTGRIMSAAAGLVYAPAPPWPQGVGRPMHWLRTDLPGLMPYVGAGGDERDVRLWAWLAFLRQSQVIGWDGALPHANRPDIAADPNELTWFYPGRWFGVDQPVPTIQLKWLRRAEQDYEYLHLARQRGEVIYALIMSRLMIKPVQTTPDAEPDPTHGLLSGTTDAKAWVQALDLLARQIELHQPGAQAEEEAVNRLNLETQNWIAPQERPLLTPRNTSWGRTARQGNWVDLRLGIDIYNAADMPLEGELQWVSAPKGWEFNPQPLVLDPRSAVSVFQVKQVAVQARVDLDRLGPETRKPIQLKFTDSLRNRPSSIPLYVSVSAPVAASDRREGKLNIDANLGDWDDNSDAIHIGPLVSMLDRPTLQKQTMQPASTESRIYSNWVAKQFYLAFKLEGVSAEPSRVERNFVDYQFRRAWGEDLCEILIQPIYDKAGDLGQVVHVVCKPKGQMVFSTKQSPRNQRLVGAAFKEVVVAAEVLYQTAVEGGTWRGELQIPWTVINDKDHQGQLPKLLRFNFVQHKGATGESASWAGPIDYGRDDSFMGLLYLRDVKAPGMAEAR